MHFILGGLVGFYLSPNPCFATLPITLIIVGSTFSAPVLSHFMQKFGRKLGFIVGCFFGGLGAGIATYAIYVSSFTFFLLGSIITGIYMSSYGFYRFAATDTARENFRPKAIAYVVAAGLVSAILGSQLVKLTSGLTTVPFLASYLAIICLNLTGPLIFAFLTIPIKDFSRQKVTDNTRLFEILNTTQIKVAIFCGMVSYGLMNLMMTSTPLAVVGCGFTEHNAADVVMTHVLAMAIPSFFTGHLIIRFGTRPVILLGIFFLFLAAVTGLSGLALTNFFIALVLLGVGWNFSFIGSTTLLTNSHKPSERGKVQGFNDMFVFGFVALASLASGGLMNCAGENSSAGWMLVNLAMFPLLVIASIALVSLPLKDTISK